MVGPAHVVAEGDLLTVAQVLKVLPVGRSTFYRLLDEGQLPHLRVSAAGSRRGRILIVRKDLYDFIEKTRQSAPRAPTRVDVDGILARVRGQRRGGLADG